MQSFCPIINQIINTFFKIILCHMKQVTVYFGKSKSSITQHYSIFTFLLSICYMSIKMWFKPWFAKGLFSRHQWIYDAQLCHLSGLNVLPVGQALKYSVSNETNNYFTPQVEMLDSDWCRAGQHFLCQVLLVNILHDMWPWSTSKQRSNWWWNTFTLS